LDKDEIENFSSFMEKHENGMIKLVDLNVGVNSFDSFDPVKPPGGLTGPDMILPLNIELALKELRTVMR